MHPGAYEFIGRYATEDDITVIEVGSRDINGSARIHFPRARWTGLDLYPGPAVDHVGNGLDYDPSDAVDLVVIAEVFEHCPYWQKMLRHVSYWLKPGGRIIITCAGPGRDPHSAIDGRALRPDEHYANITAKELSDALHEAGFEQIEVSGNEYWRDTYGIATKA